MQRVDEFWSSFFGLNLAEWQQDNLKIVPHAALGDYSGAWLFRREESLIISAPQSCIAVLTGALQHRSCVADEDVLALFGDAVETVIGPAYHGYLDEGHFQPVTSATRLLTARDGAALQELEQACLEQEWQHAGISEAQQPVFGLYSRSKLVAAANYQMWAHDVATPGLVVHPDHRGRGYGKAVLSAAAQHALQDGFLVLYQTLMSNVAAQAVAQSLGFQQYATHVAVRLRDAGEQRPPQSA